MVAAEEIPAAELLAPIPRTQSPAMVAAIKSTTTAKASTNALTWNLRTV
jgi:uncharacterized ParB-like nuclease family protein